MNFESAENISNNEESRERAEENINLVIFKNRLEAFLERQIGFESTMSTHISHLDERIIEVKERLAELVKAIKFENQSDLENWSVVIKDMDDLIRYYEGIRDTIKEITIYTSEEIEKSRMELIDINKALERNLEEQSN